MNTQKNYTLELLKLFASYMVVFIHILFYGKLGVAIDALARFAVPFFFLLSGYHSYQISPKKIIKRTRNILTLFILAVVSYTLFNITMFLLQGDIDGMVAYLGKYIEVETLINFFIYNVFVGVGHLWYLIAIIYVYIVFYFATVFRFNEKAVLFVSILLLFLHILLGEGFSAFGIVVPIKFIRNFALMGIPFFTLGLFAKKHKNKLSNIPNCVIVISAVIGALESLLSRYLFRRNEIYIGSLFVLFSIVAIFVKHSDIKYPQFLSSLAGCSTYIYIFHIMIASVVNEIYKLFDISVKSSTILKYTHPIIVCIVSTAFAYGVVQLLNVVSLKNKNKY